MTHHAYCLDDETSWFDWSLLSKRADLLGFVALLNAERSMRVEREQDRCCVRSRFDAIVLSAGTSISVPRSA